MKPVFFDIDTQIDFLFPAGALYVPGAERLLPALKRLNHYAAANGIPVVSTMDAHTENDPEFQEWPPHCVVGTAGQQKPVETLLEKRVTIPVTPTDFSIDGAQQIILETQTIDFFDNPNVPRLLEQLAASRYVVYGVVTEVCVSRAITGLLQLGKPVDLVSDAIQSLDPEKARIVIAEFTASGGNLTTLAEICPQ